MSVNDKIVLLMAFEVLFETVMVWIAMYNNGLCCF